MSHSTLSERDLARQIQQRYEEERALYEARKHDESIPSRRPAPATASPPDVWLRLVRFCAGRGIDVVAYIQWAFDNALLVGKAPAPQQLLNSQTAAAYLDACKEDGREVEVAFRVQQQTARTHILLAQSLSKLAPEDAWAAVLLDETLPLSALYRYCLAHSIGGERFLRIAQIYEQDAARQYRRSRADYDTVWGRWIPEQLRMTSL